MFSFLSSLFSPAARVPDNIYDYKVDAIDGGIIDFAAFRGKKILIVNTASFCGFTSQYQELEMLYRQYSDKLVIVGFPANNFMFQEPASNDKIAAFCKMKYDVTFPMAAKVSVKGLRKAPIYHWLTRKKYNKHADNAVKWNFQKYLINEQGVLTNIFYPKTSPLDAEVISAVNK
jgi:glutathione peroxidase